MVRLDDIELEVLARVFEYVVDTSPKSAFSFACTSKYYYSSYQLVSHRDKRITYFQHPQSRDHLLDVNLDNWLADSNIIRGLRHLSIDHAWFSKDDTCDPNRPQLLELVTLLQKLSRLTFLDWNIGLPIPPSILDALHKYQPDAELRVFYFTRDKQTGDENDPDEISLSNSPALTAIRTSLYQNGHYPDLRLACFQRIVASAPNLRFASVSEIQAQGCLDFSFTEYQKRAIKTLAKKFHAHHKPNPALRRLVMDGWEVSGLSQAEWGKFLDLAQLEDIKISGGPLDVHHLPYAAQVLCNLKHLLLDLRCTDTVVTGPVHDFLTSLAPLRSLSLSSWMESVSLDAILLRHGSTLETLHLHELEHDERSRQLVTANEVERIRVDCPNLRDLTIDCTRHSETLPSESQSCPPNNISLTTKISRILCLPFFHAAMVPLGHITPLKGGQTSYVMRRFQLEDFLRYTEQYRITEVFVVPPIIVSILQSPLIKKYSLKSLRWGMVGGAALDLQSQKAFSALMNPSGSLSPCYGMTELSCIGATYSWPEADKDGAVGYFMPNLDIRLLDEHDQDVQSYNSIGELLIRGPTVITGYLKAPEANVQSFYEGWFRTGDIAYCDAVSKKWYIVDRKKLIKVRGFQVAPPELEAVLMFHPSVLDAAVIGVRALNAVDGEAPRAYVVKQAGSTTDALTEAELQKYVAGRVAKYKALNGGIVFLDSLPKTASGKYLKRQLRERFARESKGQPRL